MVAIKTFAQLSLSRPSSQTSSARSPNSASPTSTGGTSVLLVPRPHCNEDYYLSDDQLVLHERPGRSKSAGPNRGVNNDYTISYSSPPAMKLASHAADDVGTHSSPANKLSALSPHAFAAVKSRQHVTLAPAAPVTNGHPIQPTPQLLGAHRPLLSSLLSVSNKQSPAISRDESPMHSTPASPKAAHAAGISNLATTQLQHLEASYVSKVGTRLKDLVNRVFPSAIDNGLGWMGRSAPRPSEAVKLGEALKHELAVSSCDSYILRSLLRTAAIPALTVYVGRLDPLLLLPSIEQSVLFVPRSTKDVDSSLPVGLRYNIEVIKSAWEVRCALDDILAKMDWQADFPKVLRDGLGPFVSKLDAIIQRFMGPYLVQVKAKVTDQILKFRTVEPTTGVLHTKAHLSLSRSHGPIAAHSTWSLPAQTSEHLRDLAALLEGIRKLFFAKFACHEEIKRWIVSVASQAVWKGMLAFATRSPPISLNPPRLTAALPSRTSTPQPHAEMSSGLKGGRSILRPGKRSPSPPNSPELVFDLDLSFEVRIFTFIINQFVKDIAGLEPQNSQRPSPPRCSHDCELCSHGFLINSGDDGDLVRDAMNEALEALSAFELVLYAMRKPSQLWSSLGGSSDSAHAQQELDGHIAYPHEDSTSSDGVGQPRSNRAAVYPPSEPGCMTLGMALQELPPLILLHAIASRINTNTGFRLPHEIWRENWTDYEAELRGFVAAESWTPEVALEMMKEAHRITQDAEATEEKKMYCNTKGLAETKGHSDWSGLLIIAIKVQVGIDSKKR